LTFAQKSKDTEAASGYPHLFMNIGRVKNVEERVVHFVAYVREGNIFVRNQLFEGLAWVIRN
jgi:hypothetical protein